MVRTNLSAWISPSLFGRRLTHGARLLCAFLAFSLLPATRAQGQDIVNAVRVSDCCFTFAIRNANQQQQAITEFDVKADLRTQVLHNATAPSGWTISYTGFEKVTFQSSVNSLQPGAFLDGFTVCFQTPGNGFLAQWLTLGNGLVLTGAPMPLACRDVDSVAVRVDTSDCCFAWTIKNRNTPKRPITRVTLTLATPGFTWGNGAVAPSPGWTVRQTLPERLDFDGSAAPLASGIDLQGFVSCLWPPSTAQNMVSVEWITWSDTSILHRDTVAIQCHPLRTCDAVLFDTAPSGSCCYTFTLFNNHTPGGNLNGLNFKVLTPGASITGTPTGPWVLRRSNATEASFAVPTDGLDDGKVLSGFTLCFENAHGNPEPVRVLWQSAKDGFVLCSDTLLVPCRAAGPLCDYVAVQPGSAAPAQACCYALTVHNTHTPAGTVDGLRVRILSAGVTFASPPGGPWSIASSSSTEVLFRSTAVPLPSGMSAGTFALCLRSAGPATFLVLWETLNGAAVLCRDTLRLACTPAQQLDCDSLLLAKVQDCSYDAGFVNRHTPAGAITGFHIRMISPGATISSVIPPSGWSVQSSTGNSVVFATSGAGVPPAGRQTGFKLTISPSGGAGAATFEWCTSLHGTIICCDTAVAQCAARQLCDSLEIADGASSCSFVMGLINRHTPASTLNGFRIAVSTPGAAIALAAAPAGWTITNQTGTSVVFRDTSGVIDPTKRADGFQLTFTAASGNPAVLFTWCSLSDGTDLCCGQATVQCREQQTRCDSVGLQPTVEACTFTATVANTHTPASPLDALTFRIATPGAAIASAIAPAGWKVTQQTQTVVTFRDTLGALATGGSASGFQLAFTPPSLGSAIRMQWCTSWKGADLCCDSALVECQTATGARDSVAVLPDGQRDCCYEFRLFNRHLPPSLINGLRLSVLTPGVTLFTTLVGGPPGWTPTATSTSVTWRSLSQGLSFGSILPSCVVCFDNNAIANGDFRVLWESLLQDQTITADTQRIACARTLDVERLEGAQPTDLTLSQNYPNPFTSLTTLQFDVPDERRIRLELVDAAGAVLRSLAEGVYARGRYRAVVDAAGLPNGVYFARLRSGTRVLTTALVVIR